MMNQGINSDEEWVRKMLALLEGETHQQEEQELTDDEVIDQFVRGLGIFAEDT